MKGRQSANAATQVTMTTEGMLEAARRATYEQFLEELDDILCEIISGN